MKIKNFTELSKILFENSNAILHDLVEKHTTIRNHRFKAFWRNSPDFNCAIKGNFIRDFSHQVNYNIISFSREILRIENPLKTLAEIYFPHQIEYIFDKNEDTNLDSNQNKSTDFKINIPVVEYKEKESTEKKGLIDKKIFSNHQKTYFHTFCQNLNIASSHLEKWNVGTELSKYNDTDYTVFVYENLDNENTFAKFIKYNQNGNRQKNNFSLKAYKEKGFYFEKCFFGEHLIDFNLPFIFVESEKSAVIASWFYPQYNFLATGGANGITNNNFNHFLDRIKSKNIDIETCEFYYFADDDSAGKGTPNAKNKTENKLFSFLNTINCVFIDINKEKISTQKGFDIADYCIDFYENNQKNVENIENFIQKKYYFQPFIKKNEAYHIKINEKISEIKNEIIEFISHNPFTILESCAGSGKTFTFLKDILPHFKNSFFAVPQTIQAKQIEKEYNLITAYGDKIIDEEYLGQSIKVATYDKLGTISDNILENIDIIVIDESHLLTDAFEYRAKTINELQKIIHFAKEKNIKIVFLSATPDANFSYLDNDFISLKVNQSTQQQINLTSYIYEKNALDSLLSILLSENWQDNQCRVIRIDNKQNAMIVINELIKRGILQESETDFVFADKRKNCATETRLSIEENNLIPEHKKLVFVTKIFDIGINILNKNIKPIYFSSKKELPRSVVQFFARFRSIEHLNVFLYQKEQKTRQKIIFEVEKNLKMLSKNAENLKNCYENIDNLGLKKSKVIKNNKEVYRDFLLYDNKKMFINIFEILANVSKKQCFSLSNEDIVNELSGLDNYTITKEPLSKNVLSVDDKDNLKKLTQEIKEHKKKCIQNFANNFENTVKDIIKNFVSGRQYENDFNTFFDANEEIIPIAKTDREADLQSNFVNKVVQLKNLGIENDNLCAKIVAENHSPQKFGNVISILKNQSNYFYSQYGHQNLSKLHLKQKNEIDILNNLMQVCEKISDEKSFIFENDIKNISNEISILQQKKNLTKKEQAHLQSLTKKLLFLNDCHHYIEIDVFLDTIFKKLGDKKGNLHKKNLLSQIETLFCISRKKVRIKTKNKDFSKTMIKIERKKTLLESLSLINLSDYEAESFIDSLKNRIEFEKIAFEKLNENDKIYTELGYNSIKNKGNSVQKKEILYANKLYSFENIQELNDFCGLHHFSYFINAQEMYEICPF